MSRKKHLMGLTNRQLEEYRKQLRTEQAAVLAEMALREEVADWSTEADIEFRLGWMENQPPKR
jgi:hypothetical protein